MKSYSRAHMVQLSLNEMIRLSEHPSTSRVHPIKEKSTTMTFKEKQKDLIPQKNEQRMISKLEMTSGAFM